MENWKLLLKRMKLEHIKRQTPGAFEMSGGYKMKVNPYSDETANGLTRCIIDFVTFSGGYGNRISTIGVMRKVNGQMKWCKGNTNKGAFDIRLVYKGRSLDVEVKIGKDRMSEAQLKEQQRIIAAGGLAFVARDFPMFLEWWQSLGFEAPQYNSPSKIIF